MPAPKLSPGKLRAAQSFSLEAGDQALLEQVIDFYHETLLASPEALAYLVKRGLTDPDLIRHFKLGYANRTLAYRLAPKQNKAGAELRSALQRIGILRDSGHEHLNGSIVVPLRDTQGQVVQATYSVEKLGFPQRALFRLPRIESDNCGQVFAEAILKDSRKTIAVGR